MPKATKAHKPHNHWSLGEDQDLKKLVNIHGARKWKVIASKMETVRDAKQCRERYHGHLESKINKKPLTQEEDYLIVHYRNLGYGWAEISRAIQEKLHTVRTPNQLKNNYNQRLKKLHPNVKLPDQIVDLKPELKKKLHNASNASIISDVTIESIEKDKLRIEAYVAKSIEENNSRYNNIAEQNKTEIANFAATNTITNNPKKCKFEAIDAKTIESNKVEIGNIVAKSNEVEIGNIVAKSNKVEIANFTTNESKMSKFEAKSNVEYSIEFTIISKPRKKRKTISKMDVKYITN